MGINDKIRGYFCSERSTEFNQIVIAFASGLLLGPFSVSLVTKFIFIIIYEVIIFYYTRHAPKRWRYINRLATNCAGLYGYFLGRWLITGITGLEFLVRN